MRKVSEEERKIVEDLADRIIKTMSEANQPLLISALSLSLATVQFIEIVGKDHREELRDLIRSVTEGAIDALEIFKTENAENIN